MSMDVFEAAGVAPPVNQAMSAQPNQSADVFQMAGIAPPQNMPTAPAGIFNATSTGAKLPLDAVAGLASYGHDLLNMPHQIANSPAFSSAMQLTGFMNPGFNVYNNLSDAAKQRFANAIPTQSDYDFSQMLGVKNPNAVDTLTQGAFHYAPYVAGAVDTAASLGKPLLNSALNFVRPQSAANDILQNLGGGQSLEDNAQSLAQSLKAAYEKNVKAGQELYNPITNAYGNSSIYENVVPENSSYQSLDKDIFGSYDRKLNKLQQNFSQNPTFQNAHDLQSQLGSAVRKLQGSDAKGNLSVADRSTMQGYQEAQDALRSDMNAFLSSKDQSAADQYQKATANWAINVVPYTETPKLAQIVKGDITNPTPAQINSIFKSPEPEVQKVVSDMGANANNQILYNYLGKSNYQQPEDLMKAFGRLNDQGLGSYITPSLEEQFSNLGKQISNRDYALKGAGTAAVGLGVVPAYHWVKHILSGGQ